MKPPPTTGSTTLVPRRLFNLRVSTVDDARLEAIALERGMTRSQVVRVLLKEEYEKLEALGKIKPTPVLTSGPLPKIKKRKASHESTR